MSNIDDDKTDPQATLYDEKAEEPSLLDDLRATLANLGLGEPAQKSAAHTDEPAVAPRPVPATGGITMLHLLGMMAMFPLMALIMVGFMSKAHDAGLEEQKKVESSQIEQQ